jgi:ATP-dependent Clp protease ATP-binding subunit ClpC
VGGLTVETLRIPYATWTDRAGLTTACLIEMGISAASPSMKEAVEEVEGYVKWLDRNFEHINSDFHDASLVEFPIQVRGEYREQDRVYPCATKIQLNVTAVLGKREDGQRLAVLPLFSHSFYYHDEVLLREMVAHYVQEHLKGQPPERILALLTPLTFGLGEIVLRAGRRTRSADDEDRECTALKSVAERLGSRSHRSQGAHAWERETELKKLLLILTSGSGNVLLVGPPGSGKSALLATAARRLDRRPDFADDEESADDERPRGAPRLWLTRAAQLIAGMCYLGQWQTRCEKVLDELRNQNGIICFDRLVEVITTGGTGPGDGIAAFLQPYIEDADLRMIAETTPEELQAARRMLPSFVELFQIVNVEPMDEERTQMVLQRIEQLERKPGGPLVDKGVLAGIGRLFRRFSPYASPPGAEARFLREELRRAQRSGVKQFTQDDVTRAFATRTGLPEKLLADRQTLPFDGIQEALQRSVIGQPDACAAVASVIASLKAGVNDPRRPLGVLLFCGPTGVGKTELAKTASQFLFGHGEQPEKRLVRLDMSEYALRGAAARLICDARGRPSAFLQRVRRHPFCVVLLDEIEKASPDVFDTLLSLLDEGRLTDPYGRVTVFRSALVIMTSNLGTERQRSLGFGGARAPNYQDEALACFRPEFVNRLDAIVPFGALSHEMILEITRKELGELPRREGLSRSRMTLTWTDEVVECLARHGFDRRFGARPLQRGIEQHVAGPLARFLVENPGLTDGALKLIRNPDGSVGVELVYSR